MKKKSRVLAVSLLVCSSILFASCIGSFQLSNKLLSWNHTIGDKFVNELVFVALCIVPVYEIAMFADVLVLNSIEFWTDENPVADVHVREVKSEHGVYTVERNKSGYHIEREGSDEVVDFLFNSKDKTWSVDVNGDVTTLLKVMNESEVLMYLPDGGTMNVPLNEAGVLAYKQVMQNKTYLATR